MFLLGCASAPGGGDGGPPGRGVIHPVVSPAGCFHLPWGTQGTTLALQPDGGAQTWRSECDYVALWDLSWRATSSTTVELTSGSTTRVLTLQDGGTALVDPPLFPERPASPEVWMPGAVCSVCTPGQPLAVVGCRTPEDGPEGQCCSGACGGAIPTSPTCAPALVAGEMGSLVPGGQQCRCPVGSVSAAECSAYPKVFCGGL
ncbi:MAG: hypothetical protein ACXWLS_10545, partial [Myxococcaceae bacterium]